MYNKYDIRDKKSKKSAMLDCEKRRDRSGESKVHDKRESRGAGSAVVQFGAQT